MAPSAATPTTRTGRQMSRFPAAQPLRSHGGGRRPALLPRPAELLRRPTDFVERIRWLFALSALFALVLTPVPVLVSGDRNGWTLTLAIGSAAGLATAWLHRYRTRRVPRLLDATDALCLLLFALACPQPAIAFGVLVPALWFRSVYGDDTRRIAVYSTGMCLAISLAVPLWGVVPGQASWTSAAPVLGTLPVMMITTAVARHLALSVFERNHDLERDAALAALGSRLIGVTDRHQVIAASWVTAEAICRATPGLRATVVYDDGTDTLRVSGWAGDFISRPTTLRRDVLPAGEVGKEPVVISAPADLALASGVSSEWVCVALPDTPDGYMLLGAPSGVPREGIVATRSMLGQVALALRTCDAHEELRAQALTDGLTGLANRAAFSAAMAEALKSSENESWVLFLDLDDFKVVNDTLGHLAGDRLLSRLGALLTTTLRATDLCARLGGDEFAVLLRNATESDALRIGRRIVELVSAPVQLAEGLARIGASIGVAPVCVGSSETLVVHQADVAMYAAKSAGKNQVQFFHPGLLQLDDRSAAETELRAAVEGGELVLAYQPVLSAADGRCTAVEALVRWNHPDRGLLGPDAFLELAEETGVIIALGEQVLRSACHDAAAWNDPSALIAVHVNASPTQLAHPHFLDLVRESLADVDLAPQRLVIEVTESTVLDSATVSATLEELTRMGVGIALDDFGTGYSALTTLRSLPIDIVKIDKSFVAGALTHPADQAVVEAILQMAQRLGLHTVAEGVESVEQQAFLAAAGITALQGFLYLRPAPVAEFTTWLAENRRLTAEGALAGA
jgi:diguanylate cyclase (GGDEF)-like protein